MKIYCSKQQIIVGDCCENKLENSKDMIKEKKFREYCSAMMLYLVSDKTLMPRS